MSETTILEPTSRSDLVALARIREIAAVKEYTKPNGPSPYEVSRHYSAESETIISKIINGEYTSRIARVGSEVVAMCVWSLFDNNAKIEFLYTHPDYQCNGYGSLLLDHALKQLDANEVELTTQSAQFFYEKWGFQRTGEFIIDEITSEEIMIRSCNRGS